MPMACDNCSNFCKIISRGKSKCILNVLQFFLHYNFELMNNTLLCNPKALFLYQNVQPV
jgi:hypothetical protein